MTYDDFLFYLPGFASVPLVIAGMLAMWLAWKMLKRRKKPDALIGTAKPDPAKTLTKPRE